MSHSGMLKEICFVGQALPLADLYCGSQECLLYNASGQRIWEDKRTAIADTCRNRRRDFFVVKMIRIPPLTSGQYSLKVTITDPASNRGTQATLPIQIGER